MISVIVPVYNTEPVYLKRCLDALLAQRYQAFEILLIDDGSDAATTVRLLNDYSENEKITLIRGANSGVSEARNRGLAHAGGEFICFVDSDDFVTPDCFENAMACFDDTTDAVFFKTVWQDEQGRKIKTDCNAADAIKVFDLSEPRAKNDFLRACLCWDRPDNFTNSIRPEIWAKIFRKNVIGGTRFCREMTMAEDQLFTVGVLQNAQRIKIIDKIGYCYLERKSSLMHTRSPETADQYLAFFRQLLLLFEDKSNILLYEKAYYTYREMLEIFPLRDINDKEKYQAVLHKIHDFRQSEPIKQYLDHIPLVRAKNVPIYDRLLCRFGTCKALITQKHHAQK